MFLLGKTIPTVSTSGLHALIGTYYAATGGHMTIDRVNDAKVNSFVSGVESSVVHYGVTASDFLRNLRFADDQGLALSYISAIAVEEKELIDYNKGLVGGVQKARPKVRLVPIYPSDGMPVADHPFVILTHAAAKARAMQSFYDFLRQREIQETFDVNGFRYANGDAGTEMHKQEFVDTSLPGSQIPSPEGKVLDRMVNAWKTFRKPARVLILVDVSADPNALKLATERLGDAVRQLQARDWVGVWTFPAPTTSYTEQRTVSPVKDGLDITLKSISPITGPSADLAVVVQTAIKLMADSYDRNRVDAVLLVEMSPGESLTKEQVAADQKLQLYIGNQPSNRFIHLFTIGPAGNRRLQDLASFGQGLHYDPGTASNLLNDVISSI
jgi:Ca-activated chloride channel family protein